MIKREHGEMASTASSMARTILLNEMMMLQKQ
jgi:hypothetical protein